MLRWLASITCYAILLALAAARVGEAAPPVVVAEDLSRASLLPHAELLVDATAKLSVDDVAARPGDRFEPIEGPLWRAASDDAYWLRFALRNPATRPVSVVLEVTNLALDSIEVHLPAEGGGFESTILRDDPDAGPRPIDIRHPVVPITVEPGAERIGYLRLHSPGSMLTTPIEVSGALAYYARVERITLWIGLFYGVMLALTAYNLLLLAVTRDTTYLWYSVAGAALALVFLQVDRLPFLPPIAVPAVYLNETYSLASLLFTRRFLRTQTDSPRLDLAFQVAIGLLLLRIVVYAAFGTDVSPAVPLLLFVLTATVIRARQGFRPALLMVAVWTPPVLAVVLPLALFQGIGLVSWYNVIKCAVLWERAGASLAVGMRLRMLRRQGIELDRVVREEQRRRLETQQRYARLVESSPFGIAVFDRDLAIEHVNPAFLRIFGLDAAWGVGRRLPEAAPRVPASVVSRLRACIDESRLLSDERDWTLPGGTQLSVRSHLVPIHGGDGSTVGCQLLVEDVTEERSLREQLQQAQKLEAVARLASGVAHDLNNYLTSILGFSDILLKGREEDEDDETEDLRLIRDSARSSAAVTRQLLAFSRRQPIAPRVIAVSAVVTEIGRLLERMVGEDVELVIDAPDPDLRLRIDPSQLEQVLVNLVVNARDAMTTGGRVQIAVSAHGSAHDSARDSTGEDDERVAISVTDDGAGMDEDTRAHIFDPFFTTKEIGKGTGLGLATVRSVVELSGGAIEVESQLGRGTTFRILLPRCFDELDSDGSEGEPRPLPSLNVLVVDDDDGVRALVRQVLERAGHSVRHAQSGPEALRILSGDGPAVDLLVTDVVMPGMSGPEVHRRVAEAHPRVHVLYLTGYAEREEFEEIQAAGARLLSKPFSPEQLVFAVQRVVEGAGPG